MTTTTHTLIICPASTSQQARDAAEERVGRPTFARGVPGVSKGGGDVQAYAWDLPVRDEYWQPLVDKAEELGADIYLRDEGEAAARGYPHAASIDDGLSQSGYQRQKEDV
jgi:hypothetical protein